MSVTVQEEQRGQWASDLAEHPGFLEFLKDCIREAVAARAVIFHGQAATADELGLKVARARGTLDVLRNVLLEVYRRGNTEPPERVKALFE